MGFLEDGEWVLENLSAKGGIERRFNTKTTPFRSSITRDGSSGYPADPSRYHLYVSLGCPFAHRAHITLKLKNLEDKIQVSIVDPVITESEGWVFSEYPGSNLDPVNNFTHLRQVYLKSDPSASGRVTVPVLFDKVTQKIVNNESSEIIEMLNECFDGPDLYPIELRPKIDEVNQWVLSEINNGVYKCGFVTDQNVYEHNVIELFKALDKLEEILETSRYLVGNVFTLADVRLFPTLIRFDAAYYGHFKCNLRRIVDYPNIWNYVKDVYQMPGIADTVNIDHIKRVYYVSQLYINPNGIVPKGPILDFSAPHNRASKFSE